MLGELSTTKHGTVVPFCDENFVSDTARTQLLLSGLPGTPQREESSLRHHFNSLANETISQMQMTGGNGSTTTLARQLTGLGLTMQMSGGGLTPTRQLMSRSPSPTKMRPKSVIGMRGGVGRAEEGRGMYLVRQMTGM